VKLFSTESYEPGLVAVGEAPIGVIAIGGAPVGVIAVGALARGLVTFSAAAGVGLVSVGIGFQVGLWARSLGPSLGLVGDGIGDQGGVFVDGWRDEGLTIAWTLVKAVVFVAVMLGGGASVVAQLDHAEKTRDVELTLVHRADLVWKATLVQAQPAHAYSDCTLTARMRADGKRTARGKLRVTCGYEVHALDLDERTCTLHMTPLDVGGVYDLACDRGADSLDTAAGTARFQHSSDDEKSTYVLRITPGATSTTTLIAP
jgi:hypothetical protein